MFFATLIIAVAIVSCKKDQTNRVQNNNHEAHWITPNGYVIPFAEKDNWKNYLKLEMSNEKIGGKRYKSQGCVLENSDCNLECVETNSKDWDCIKTSACAPCINCGCSS